MKRFLIAYFSVIGLIIALGCGNADGGLDDDGSSEPPTDGCFYTCNSSFGEVYGCRVGSSITSSSDCDEEAADQCGDDGASRTAFVSDCDCQASCSPSWWEGE